jgi:hypothetical protein
MEILLAAIKPWRHGRCTHKRTHERIPALRAAEVGDGECGFHGCGLERGMKKLGSSDGGGL